jgi:long-chain acyl-CoA synthetase
MMILSDNCVELALSIITSMSLGGMDVEKENIYPVKELQNIIRIFRPEIICLQNDISFEKFMQLKIDWPVKLIFYNHCANSSNNALTLEQICALGKSYIQQTGFDIQTQIDAVKQENPATLVFTSGTTGPPKGVTLTHQNLAYAVHEFASHLYPDDSETYLSIIHIRHIGEKIAIFIAISYGYRIVLSDIPHFRADMLAEKPHIIAGSPVMLKAMKDSILAKIREAGIIKLFNFFFEWSFRFITAKRILTQTIAADNKFGIGIRLVAFLSFCFHTPFHLLAKLLLYRKIKTGTGGNVRLIVSGGAFLSNDLDDFFETIGYKLINGYGSNETAAVTSVRDSKKNIKHTIGSIVQGTEYTLLHPVTSAPCPKGEPGILHIRGPQVFAGYYGNEASTKEVLSKNGWYDTGDIVREVCSGHFVFVGRSKETISLLDRNNVEPQPIEKAIEKSPYIKMASAIGQDKPFITALIFPHIENLKQLLNIGPNQSVTPFLAKSEIKNFYKNEIEQNVNLESGFLAHELVKAFTILNEDLKAGDLLTFTMKMRRKIIAERFHAEIETMYIES